MGDIHVTADYDGLLLIELTQILAEVILPAHAVVEAAQAVLRVGGVDADKVEICVLERDDAALAVVPGDAEVIAHGHGRVSGEYRRAGVALFLGIAPVALVPGQVKTYLPFLKLRLLKADKVRVQ